MDYKIRMRNKTNLFHVNLLKEYIEREKEVVEEGGSIAVI